MKKAIFIVFVLINFAWGNDQCEHSGNSFACVKFIKNYDGDTITFDLPGVHPFFGKGAKVRVLGVDTPERKKGTNPCEKEWARVAQKLVEAELSHAKRIDVKNLDRHEKYGRILGDVVYDGKNLKDILIKNYLAVPYQGQKKTKVDWCEMKKKREAKK